MKRPKCVYALHTHFSIGLHTWTLKIGLLETRTISAPHTWYLWIYFIYEMHPCVCCCCLHNFFFLLFFIVALFHDCEPHQKCSIFIKWNIIFGRCNLILNQYAYNYIVYVGCGLYIKCFNIALVDIIEISAIWWQSKRNNKMR